MPPVPEHIELREKQIERLEGIVEKFGKYLMESTPRSKFPWEAIATILAVLGMLITGTQSWAIMGKRLDDLEARQKDQTAALEKVPRLDWQLTELQKRLNEISDTQKEQGRTLVEIRETLVKTGFRVSSGGK